MPRWRIALPEKKIDSLQSEKREGAEAQDGKSLITYENQLSVEHGTLVAILSILFERDDRRSSPKSGGARPEAVAPRPSKKLGVDLGSWSVYPSELYSLTTPQ